MNNMSLVNKKILLTGGAGFVGQHVKRLLIKKGVSPNNLIIH